MKRALPTAGERLPERTIGPFTMSDIAAYAEISGDTNPLHLDPALAKSVGLAAPPVHGMLLLASFEPALQEWRPDLRVERLSGRFTQPVLQGELVKLSGRVMRAAEDKSGILMRLLANGASRAPAIVAEAVLVRQEAP